MKSLLLVAGLLIVCGCVGNGGREDVEVVDVERHVAVEEYTTTTMKYFVTSTSDAGAAAAPTTLTSTTSTSTTSTTSATTTSTATSTSTTSKVKETTTTTTATSTTVRCVQECCDIRIPSPRNCAEGCCISPNTRCVYVASMQEGWGCRCR